MELQELEESSCSDVKLEQNTNNPRDKKRPNENLPSGWTVHDHWELLWNRAERLIAYATKSQYDEIRFWSHIGCGYAQVTWRASESGAVSENMWHHHIGSAEHGTTETLISVRGSISLCYWHRSLTEEAEGMTLRSSTTLCVPVLHYVVMIINTSNKLVKNPTWKTNQC